MNGPFKIKRSRREDIGLVTSLFSNFAILLLMILSYSGGHVTWSCGHGDFYGWSPLIDL